MTSRIHRAALLGAVLTAFAACDGGPTQSAGGTCAPSLAGVEQVMDSVVDADQPEGGLLLVMRNGQVLCERAFGGYEVAEQVQVASASKLLTAVAMLALVDEGRLTLDGDVAQHLPSFGAEEVPITLRMLLSHTSGIGDPPCIFQLNTNLALCADAIAESIRIGPPGAQFSYAGGSFTVAGALAEAVAGQTWSAVWRTRVNEPLGLQNTYWGGGRNPLLSGGATSTLQDYGRVLQMIANGGELNGRRVLSAQSIEALRRDNRGALPIASSPRRDDLGYSLGAWINAVDAQDRATEIDGIGASGFYPWVDFERGIVGIVVLPPRRLNDGYWYPVARRIQRDVRAALGSQ